MGRFEDFADVLPEVSEALHEGRPLVALESSILAHGSPYPQNVATFLSLERTVRASGAVPASIAIISGRIKIGLTASEVDRLGCTRDAIKTGRAEIPYLLASARHGATTVGATMICGSLAGIEVFATGGIGGVHRGFADTMDISSDLDELARTSIAVVCSGAKAILDIPKTLEYLETRGVSVLGYRTDRFPAFWSRESGEKVSMRAETVDQVAKLIAAKHALGLSGGVLLTNPIAQADEIPLPELEEAIEVALRRADEKRIVGKSVTPFLLRQISEMTHGRTDKAAEKLLESNVRLGALLSSAIVEAKRAERQN